MAVNSTVINRLKAQLLVSGIQQQNQALFQVINQLIDACRDSLAQVEQVTDIAGGGPLGASFITSDFEGGSLPNSKQLIAGAGIELNPSPANRIVISTAIPFGIDGGGEGEDGPPGPPGKDGPIGPIGPAGSNATALFYAFDGIDGEDAPIIPGPAGASGLQGISGLAGPQGIPGDNGEDGFDGFPGPAGTRGIDGIIGVNGTPGPPGLDAEEAEFPYLIPGPPGQSGQGVVLTAFIQNLGAGDSSGTFDITGLSGQSVGKTVSIYQTTNPIPSKGSARDEFEMDAIVLTGYVLDAATIRVYWFAANGSTVVGDYAFGYSVNVGSIGPQGPKGESNIPGIDGLDGEDGDNYLLGLSGLIASKKWADVTFSATDFTADTGTWTVGAGNVFAFAWTQIDDTILVVFTIAGAGSFVSAAPTDIKIKIPGGRIAARRTDNMALGVDAVFTGAIQIYVIAGGTTINIRKVAGTWSNVGTISVFGQFAFSV